MEIPKESNVLVVCNQGLIRSRYLCEHLKKHGYTSVDYGGVGVDPIREATLDMVDQANFIISVNPEITYALKSNRFNFPKNGQKLIQLEVLDLDHVDGDAVGDHSIHTVFSELEQQIDQYINNKIKTNF